MCNYYTLEEKERKRKERFLNWLLEYRPKNTYNIN